MPSISYCGIDCAACTYRETQRCKTCKPYKGDIWHGSCRVAKCCIEKNLEDCGQCDSFPCRLLIDFSYDETHGDGGERIRNLCRANRRAALGNNDITQVGMVVNDIEQTSKDWAELLGVPVPPVIVTDTMDIAQTQYNGQPSPARAKLAFFSLGDKVSLELIEPDRNPSTWRESLDAHGEGVHHIAFVIKGMQDKIALMEKLGLKCVQKGEYTGGRYAYLDAADNKYKVVFELLEND